MVLTSLLARSQGRAGLSLASKGFYEAAAAVVAGARGALESGSRWYSSSEHAGGSGGGAGGTGRGSVDAGLTAAAANSAGPGEMAAAHAAAQSSGVSAVDLGDYTTISPRVVVFGGNGYVGSRVCQAVLQMGVGVLSISRSGRPRNLTGDWLQRVEWAQGDALDPQQPWKGLLQGALGVVSTLGTFGSNELMYKVCGEANMRVMDAAAEASVPRFAFISVHDYKMPAGWHMEDFLLKGYFKGKRDAEKYMAEKFPTGGVALRPSFIFGSRAVGSTSIPLGLVGAPLRMGLSVLPTRTLANIPILGAVFAPPVSVETVGKAAASAVLDPAIPPGVMDVWAIEKFA